VTRLNDPTVVRDEYASERGLTGRIAAYRFSMGPDARSAALDAVLERSPRRVLEVGCGTGDLAAELAATPGLDLVAVDLSERMVELTRSRGVEALVADAQELPFADGAFDCVLAAWMLYHVPDPDRALREFARVLAPRGRLVAVTNSHEHLQELRTLVGAGPAAWTFAAEDAKERLARRFAHVERREVFGAIEFPTQADVASYLDATRGLWPLAPAEVDVEVPFRVRTRPVVFVAQKA